MPIYRCSCFAKTTGHICKNKYTYLIQNIRYCTMHAKLKFNQCITQIQALYRGYRLRKKIYTIFKPLPRELQCKIIYHMRDELYIKQQHKSIRDILKSRVTKTFNITYEDRAYGNDIFNIQHILPVVGTSVDSHINLISYTYYLHNKYFDIADTTDIILLLSWWKREIRSYFARQDKLNNDVNNTVYSMAKKWGKVARVNPYWADHFI